MNSIRIAFYMALVGLVRLLSPLVTIRFGKLFVSRLGHLAGNTECFLCERDMGLHSQEGRVFDIWTPYGKPANAQLLKMYSRVLRMWPWAFSVAKIGAHFGGWDKHTFSDAQWGRDINNLLEQSPAHLSFTKAEEKSGQQGLRDLGIPEGGKWVCVIARDSIHLKVTEPSVDYSYHSFRDSDINNYRAAALALIERGYNVVRMGVYVDGPMKLTAPGFIDYAVSGKRSDFMDVYLGAKCAFTISNGTGFDGIPMIFRRPICFVNEAPFEYLSTWMANSMAIWKHHVKDGKRMTVPEIIASGAGLFDRSEQYAKAGISLEQNSPEEIMDAAKEMADRIEWLYSMDDADRALQEKFWAAYPRSVSAYNKLPLHGEIRLRIGAKFLRSYAATL